MLDDIDIHPATPERWGDLEDIFAGKGDPAKCWCAYWYASARAFKEGWGEGNKHVLETRVADGHEPGIIAYVAGDAAGWAGIAPRSAFDRLVRNKASLAAVDDRPVWSLNCLVVRREFRRQGLMRWLITGAVEFALSKGAVAIEAYPIDAERKLTSYDLFLGTMAAYEEAGFVEVARHTPTRPIMRFWPGT